MSTSSFSFQTLTKSLLLNLQGSMPMHPHPIQWLASSHMLYNTIASLESARFRYHPKFLALHLHQNDEGLIMPACTLHHEHVSDEFIDEVLSCLQTVILARDLGFSKIVVEGDFLTIIKKLCLVVANTSIVGQSHYVLLSSNARKWNKEVVQCLLRDGAADTHIAVL
ncbi:hypothetical protein V6N13_142379 [Hibiscus sabdariffa]|uniref:RNase H type-1 domain-containing protein n=1 Tax=Hibiscus sabdariffa TaxID=183260 RepID=A0ABR2FE01_9ROSI